MKNLTYNEKKLIRAAQQGDIGSAKQALKGGLFTEPAHIECSTSLNKTALYTAVQSKQMEMVRFLVENGANLECAADKGTPLILATKINWPEGIMYLLEKGADVNAKDADSSVSAVFHAVARCDINLLKLFEIFNADFKAIHSSRLSSLLIRCAECQNVDTEIQLKTARFLIEKGNDVNWGNADNVTALMCAVERNNKKLVQYLVERGADVNACDKNGRNALIRAVQYADMEIVQTLLNNGADKDINHRDNNGKTAALIAAEYDKYDSLKLLAGYGCQLDLPDNKWNTVESVLNSKNQDLYAELKYIQSMSPEARLEDAVKQKTGNELYDMAQNDNLFLQQLVTTGMVVEAFRKMTYSQSIKLYKKVEDSLNKNLKKRIQNVIRDSRL